MARKKKHGKEVKNLTKYFNLFAAVLNAVAALIILIRLLTG